MCEAKILSVEFKTFENLEEDRRTVTLKLNFPNERESRGSSACPPDISSKTQPNSPEQAFGHSRPKCSKAVSYMFGLFHLSIEVYVHRSSSMSFLGKHSTTYNIQLDSL